MRVVVTVAFAVATAGTVQTGQAILEEIVVSVNGEPITRTEIDERLRVTREATGTREADPGLLTRVLRDAVDERLMTQRAADLRLDVSEQDVDRILANVQAESHVESDAAFDELLRAEGMSRAKHRAATRRQLLISQVRELASGNLTVSNDEALKYFTAHRQDLSTGGRDLPRDSDSGAAAGRGAGSRAGSSDCEGGRGGRPSRAGDGF